MKDFLLKRLREPSTWRGIVILATELGIVLSPDQIEAIIAAGATVVALIGVFTADPKPERVRDPAESDRGAVGVQRRAEDSSQHKLELDGRGFGDK